MSPYFQCSRACNKCQTLRDSDARRDACQRSRTDTPRLRQRSPLLRVSHFAENFKELAVHVDERTRDCGEGDSLGVFLDAHHIREGDACSNQRSSQPPPRVGKVPRLWRKSTGHSALCYSFASDPHTNTHAPAGVQSEGCWSKLRTTDM